MTKTKVSIMNRNIQPISWQDMLSNIKKLAEKLPQDRTIWGIPRNGIIIAGIIAHHRLDLKFVLNPNKDTIIIDDIYDSGKTLRPYITDGFTVATVYWRTKDSATNCPSFWAESVLNGYLLFPWEANLQ